MSTAASPLTSPTLAPRPSSLATTSRGTPSALSWDADWLAQVEARETQLNRRICGARTHGGRPCPLPSDHASGRCRHHGGFPLTGAPRHNRNAVVHGLYSRRLALVGRNDPTWTSNPFGGAAPDQGKAVAELPDADRSICPFEQAEYNAVLTDTMKRTCANPENAFGLHLAHQIALMTVMVSRAAKALANKPFTQKVEKSADNSYACEEKPSAALQAFERLTRELRRWTELLERNYPAVKPNSATALEHEIRTDHDTAHDPDSLAALDAARTLAEDDLANQKARERHFESKDRDYDADFEKRYGIKPGPGAKDAVIQKMLSGKLPIAKPNSSRLPVRSSWLETT